MADDQVWCGWSVVGPDGADGSSRVLSGPEEPDLGAVDAVARLALLAKRLGGDIDLFEVSPAMHSLLALAGSAVEVQGQAELGEEAVGIQGGEEERHPGDRPR